MVFRFALEMIKHGYRQFIVDLRQCQGMDSTFLGMLAGIGLRLHRECENAKVRVIEVNANNMELLQTLGLDRLFEVEAVGSCGAGHSLPADTEFRKLPDTDIAELSSRPDKDEAADLMLEAHNCLMQADPRNEEKFEELTRILRERAGRCASPEKKQP